jgi:hypothetical protein
MIILGMIIQDSKDNVPSYVWAFWIFSPIVLPIVIGMMLVKNKPKYNNHE